MREIPRETGREYSSGPDRSLQRHRASDVFDDAGGGQRDGSTGLFCGRKHVRIWHADGVGVGNSFAPGSIREVARESARASDRTRCHQTEEARMSTLIALVFPRTRSVRIPIAALALAVACSASAWAQGGASVGGVVKDQSGGALPGTTVTVLNSGNGASQTLVTGPSGNYLAVNLPPGQYLVSAELSGFAMTKKAVTLNVGVEST